MTGDHFSSCRVRIDLGLSSPPIHVMALRGVDPLSGLFCFEVELAADRGADASLGADADNLDLAGLLGKTAKLSFSSSFLDDAVGGEQEIHGLIQRFEQRDRGDRFTAYHATIVPRAWRLTQRSNCRIFQDQSAKDIIETILAEHQLNSGRDFKLSLSEAPPKRLFCVQYRETDWDFLGRLLEEEGIFTFLRHDEGRDVLCFGSDTAVHPAIAGTSSVPFYGRSSGIPTEEHVFAFAFGQEMRTGKVSLRDWNFLQPDLQGQGSLEVNAEGGDHAGKDLEVYDYPGRYDQVSPTGKARAKTRIEELEAGQKTGHGSSTSPRFFAGAWFALDGFYRPELNQKYLLTEVTHEVTTEGQTGEIGDAPLRYQVSFTCQPRDVPFRPARTRQKPLIHGVQTALVIGPSGEEIHTDKHGRIKVKFHWDRTSDMESASCWVRVAQIWGSGAFGGMFIPRIGQEVVVAFEEGDIDRPLVVGTVYYGPPPYALPDNKTKSTIKSNSSMGGGGSNELRFEDKKGSEEVYLHAQKDHLVQVEANETINVGADQALSVGANRQATVGKDETIEIGKDQSLSVGGAQDVTIKLDQSIRVGGNQSTTVDKNAELTVGGNGTASIGKNLSVDVGASGSLTIGKDWAVTVSGAATTDIGKDVTLSSGANISETAKSNYKLQAKKIAITAEDELAITVGDAKLVMKKNGDITLKGKKITLEGSGDIQAKASGNLVLKGSKIAGN